MFEPRGLCICHVSWKKPPDSKNANKNKWLFPSRRDSNRIAWTNESTGKCHQLLSFTGRDCTAGFVLCNDLVDSGRRKLVNSIRSFPKGHIKTYVMVGGARRSFALHLCSVCKPRTVNIISLLLFANSS